MAGAPAFARPAATGADRLQSRFRRGGPGPAPMTPTAKSAPRPPKPWTDAPRLALRLPLTLIAMLSVAAQPVLAQSILRDAETEALLQDMMDPLPVPAGLRPGAAHGRAAGGERV